MSIRMMTHSQVINGCHVMRLGTSMCMINERHVLTSIVGWLIIKWLMGIMFWHWEHQCVWLMSVMLLLLVCMIIEHQDDDSFNNSGIQESNTFYIKKNYVCNMRITFNSILKLAQFCSKIQEFRNSKIQEFRNSRIQEFDNSTQCSVYAGPSSPVLLSNIVLGIFLSDSTVYCFGDEGSTVQRIIIIYKSICF